jgi:hypothetical protein
MKTGIFALRQRIIPAEINSKLIEALKKIEAEYWQNDGQPTLNRRIART